MNTDSFKEGLDGKVQMPVVSCQIHFWPFVSCQVNDY